MGPRAELFLPGIKGGRQPLLRYVRAFLPTLKSSLWENYLTFSKIYLTSLKISLFSSVVSLALQKPEMNIMPLLEGMMKRILKMTSCIMFLRRKTW